MGRVVVVSVAIIVGLVEQAASQLCAQGSPFELRDSDTAYCDVSCAAGICCYGNLGGLGPHFDEPEELRFYDIGVGYDMVVTAVGAYDGAWRKNGLNQKKAEIVGQISLTAGTSATLKFTFVYSGGSVNNSADLVDPFDFTMFFLDIDHDGVDNGASEAVEVYDFSKCYVAGSRSAAVVNAGNDQTATYDHCDGVGDDSVMATEVNATTVMGGTRFESSIAYGGNNNPSDTMALDASQQRIAVAVEFANKNTFTIKYETTGDSLRNLLFSTRSNLIHNCPTGAPTTSSPTTSPSVSPTSSTPTKTPSVAPTISPTTSPTTTPTISPTISNPTAAPTSSTPTTSPTTTPTTSSPSVSPSVSPTVSSPTASPSTSPTTSTPTTTPTQFPTTSVPTLAPTGSPTTSPTASPTLSSPTTAPTHSPTTSTPTTTPTTTPTASSPTASPTALPTLLPSRFPSANPTTSSPTTSPTTSSPSVSPSLFPTRNPTFTRSPSIAPTFSSPTTSPVSSAPTTSPTTSPSISTPTSSPFKIPTDRPTTSQPTAAPITSAPTASPIPFVPKEQPFESASPTTATPTTTPPTTPPTVSSEALLRELLRKILASTKDGSDVSLLQSELAEMLVSEDLRTVLANVIEEFYFSDGGDGTNPNNGESAVVTANNILATLDGSSTTEIVVVDFIALLHDTLNPVDRTGGGDDDDHGNGGNGGGGTGGGGNTGDHGNQEGKHSNSAIGMGMGMGMGMGDKRGSNRKGKGNHGVAGDQFKVVGLPQGSLSENVNEQHQEQEKSNGFIAIMVLTMSALGVLMVTLRYTNVVKHVKDLVGLHRNRKDYIPLDEVGGGDALETDALLTMSPTLV